MWRLAIGASAMLAACAPAVESATPLFTPGAESLKPGLWAMLGKKDDKPCPLPSDAAVMRWPDCAAPVLVEKDALTYLRFGTLRATYLLAGGAPRIVQLDRNLLADMMSAVETSSGPSTRRFYLGFTPSSAEPYTDGKLTVLLCPSELNPDKTGAAADAAPEGAAPAPPPIAGLSWIGAGENGRCIADRPEAVRELARRAALDEKTIRLVWIAPYP